MKTTKKSNDNRLSKSMDSVKTGNSLVGMQIEITTCETMIRNGRKVEIIINQNNKEENK